VTVCRWELGCIQRVSLVEGRTEELCYFHGKILGGLITSTRRASSTYQVEPVRMPISLELKRARRRASTGEQLTSGPGAA